MPKSGESAGDLRKNAMLRHARQHGGVESEPSVGSMPELVPDPALNGRPPTEQELEQQRFYRRQEPQVAVRVALDWTSKEFSALGKQHVKSSGAARRRGRVLLSERRGHAKEVMNAWERVNMLLTRANGGQKPILTWDEAENRPKFLELYINAQRLLETYTQAYRSRETGQESIAQAARQSLNQIGSARPAQGGSLRLPAGTVPSQVLRTVRWAPGTHGGSASASARPKPRGGNWTVPSRRLRIPSVCASRARPRSELPPSAPAATSSRLGIRSARRSLPGHTLATAMPGPHSRLTSSGSEVRTVTGRGAVRARAASTASMVYFGLAGAAVVVAQQGAAMPETRPLRPPPRSASP